MKKHSRSLFIALLLFCKIYAKNVLFYNDLDEDPSALCSDGSPGGYFFRPAASPFLPWIILLDPAAVPCFGLLSCSLIANSTQTSSSMLPSRLTFEDGILNIESDSRLLQANLVFIPHCSADAFIGNRPIPPAEVLPLPSFKSGFNGKIIVEAVLTDLIKTHGLGEVPEGSANNTTVLVAGGLSTLVGCSYYAEFIESSITTINNNGNVINLQRFVDVKCFVDNKMWLQRPALPNSDGLGAEAIVELLLGFVGGQQFLSLSQRQCFVDNVLEPHVCLLGDVVLNYLPGDQPLFINMQLYDAFQLVAVDGLSPVSSPNSWTSQETDYAQDFRAAATRILANEVMQHGAEFRSYFAAACYDPVEAESGKPWSLLRAFSQRLVAGLSLEESLSHWVFNESLPSNGQTLDPYRGINSNAYCIRDAPYAVYSISADLEALPLNVLDDHFIGVTLDVQSLGEGLDLLDPVLANLGRNLNPASVLVGGLASDRTVLIDSVGKGRLQNASEHGGNILITANSLRDLSSFAFRSNLSLSLTLNSGPTFRSLEQGSAIHEDECSSRNVSVSINEGECILDAPYNASNSNITSLLELVEDEDLCVDSMSIGSAPDLYSQLVLSGTQLAKDLIEVQNALIRYALRSIHLSGPAWSSLNSTRAIEFFRKVAGKNLAATLMAYPLSSSSFCDMDSLTDADLVGGAISRTSSAWAGSLRSSGARVPFNSSVVGSAVGRDPSRPRLVIEQSSLVFGQGGCAGASDRFVSIFALISALNVPFINGLQQVNIEGLTGWRSIPDNNKAEPLQSSLVGPPGWSTGSQGLLTNIKPNYYLLLLFKKLVGASILKSKATRIDVQFAQGPERFSTHIWCAGPQFSAGSVVLIISNGHNHPVNFDVTSSSSSGGTPLPLTPRTEFVITTASATLSNVDGLLSTRIILNNGAEPLNVTSDGLFTMPQGIYVPFDELAPRDVTVPPFSISFLVLTGTEGYGPSQTCLARSGEGRRAYPARFCPGPSPAPTPKPHVDSRPPAAFQIDLIASTFGMCGVSLVVILVWAQLGHLLLGGFKAGRYSPGALYWLSLPPRAAHLLFIFITFTSQLIMGYEYTVISGVKTMVAGDLGINTTCPKEGGYYCAFAFFGAAMPLGAAFGTLFSSRLQDQLGRKVLLTVCSLFYVASTASVFTSDSPDVFTASRLASGLALGIFSSSCPAYIAELCPRNVRGMLVIASQFGTCVGSVLGYTATYLVAPDWRIAVAATIPPAALLSFFFVFVTPSSPRFLVNKGKLDVAQAVLRSIREGDAADTEAELKEVCASAKSGGFSLLPAPVLWPTVVCIGLGIIQQLTGVAGITVFATDIFPLLGFKRSNEGALLAIVFGTTRVLFMSLATMLMARMGRRALLLRSFIGMAVMLLVGGIAIIVTRTFEIRIPGGENPLGELPEVIAMLAGACLVCFAAAFEIGLGPIFYLLVAELAPSKVRSDVGTLSTSAMFFSQAAVVAHFPIFLSSFGGDVKALGGLFVFYAAFCLIGYVFSYKYVFETKGTPLATIESEMANIATLPGSIVAVISKVLQDRFGVSEDGVIASVQDTSTSNSAVGDQNKGYSSSSSTSPQLRSSLYRRGGVVGAESGSESDESNRSGGSSSSGGTIGVETNDSSTIIVGNPLDLDAGGNNRAKAVRLMQRNNPASQQSILPPPPLLPPPPPPPLPTRTKSSRSLTSSYNDGNSITDENHVSSSPSLLSTSMTESPMGQQLSRSQTAPPMAGSTVKDTIKSLQERLVKREITFEQYLALKSAL